MNETEIINNGLAAYIFGKAAQAGRTYELAEALKQMEQDGWVTITPERQPYRHTFDLYAEIKLAGFEIASKPVFEVGSKMFTVKTARYPFNVPATDKPEDLLRPTDQLFKHVMEWFRDNCKWNYIFSICAYRSALFNLLPPECIIHVRGARVVP